MKIGDILKQVRLERGLKTTTVAEAIDVTAAAISQIENNKNAPSYMVLEALCDFYQIDKYALIFLKREYIDITDFSEINKEKILAISNLERHKK